MMEYYPMIVIFKSNDDIIGYPTNRASSNIIPTISAYKGLAT